MPELKRSHGVWGATSIGIGATAYEFNKRHYSSDVMEKL